jgi:hypothetical protein
VGGVFGVAVLGSIVTGRFASALATAFDRLGLPPAIAAEVAKMAQEGRRAGTMPTLPGVDMQAVQTAIKDSFTTGMHRAMLVAGIVLLAGAVVGAITIRHTSPDAQLARRKHSEPPSPEPTAVAAPVSED